MIIWGKLICAILGFTCYNLIGLILGLVLGHFFDHGLSMVLSNKYYDTQMRMNLFSTLFQTLGYLDISDSIIFKNKKHFIQKKMFKNFRLNQLQILSAIKFFNEGKHPDFDISMVLNKFSIICVKQTKDTTISDFLKLLIQTLKFNNISCTKEIYKKLEFIYLKLNVSFSELDNHLIFYNVFSSSREQNWTKQNNNSLDLDKAYSLLNVNANDDIQTVQKAYRRLLNKYHPDKLLHKGLSNKTLNIAQEKFKQIYQAYHLIIRSKQYE